MTPSGLDLREAASRCVKCGLCLPHCPTWKLAHREGDSPRGRIELMAALNEGQLEWNAATQARLDPCLMCRACEAVCPAQVPFARMMDQTRGRWPVRRVWQSVAFASLRGRAMVRLLLRWVTESGMARLLWSRLRVHWAGLLPGRVIVRRRALASSDKPAVGIFTGCVTDVVDRATLNDASVLLEHTGVPVRWVEGAGCCGALHRHQGNTDRAEAQYVQNVASATRQSCTTLVSVASACAAEFMDCAARTECPSDPSGQPREILAYLANRPEALTFQARAQTVWLHQPCTARYPLADTDSANALLERVPQLRVKHAQGRNCCGAAGVTMFRAPQQAQALGEAVAGEFLHSQAEVLLTSNIGCAMHLRQILRSMGHDTAVCHPVNLLREQLSEPSCDN